MKLLLLYNPAFFIPFGDDSPKENGDNTVAVIIGGVMMLIFIVSMFIEMSKEKKN